MLSSLFQSCAVPEQVVKFTEARHGVLAGNVANLDTPGYRARDLSPALFQERLKEAINSRYDAPANDYDSDPFDFNPTSAAERRANRQLAAFQKVEDASNILRHDEGAVNMEEQVNEIVKNQQQHNLAIGIMSAQFRLLKAAITERVA